MINVKIFVFNAFQVNTYVVYDNSRECLIIDAACSNENERCQLEDFIKTRDLKPVKALLTHAHVDHIMGSSFVKRHYKIPLLAHSDCAYFLKTAASSAEVFGLELDEVVYPDQQIVEGDTILFGSKTFFVLETPGHANGSLCFYSKEEKILFSGDVLFNGGIGRTDLPTGNYDLLMESIKEKLFTMDGDFKVFPGHGPETTIEIEREENPFF